GPAAVVTCLVAAAVCKQVVPVELSGVRTAKRRLHVKVHAWYQLFIAVFSRQWLIVPGEHRGRARVATSRIEEGLMPVLKRNQRHKTLLVCVRWGCSVR